MRQLLLLTVCSWMAALAIAIPDPGIGLGASAGVDVGADFELSAGLDANIDLTDDDSDSSIYDGPIEWSDDCDCKLQDNDYYDDILYIERRYQDFNAIRDFRDYVDREVDTTRRHFFNAYSNAGITAIDNEIAFDRLRLRPRILRNVGVRDTTTQLLGDDVSFPLGIAPMPFFEYADPDGEIGVAQAAECEGVPYIVSAFANTDLEEIAASSRHANLWMETFIFFDRSITQSIVERAEASGYRAIVISVDLPELGNLVDVRRDHTVLPDYLSVPNIENDESNESFIHEDSDGDRSVVTAIDGVGVGFANGPKMDRNYIHRHHILSQIELVKGNGFYRTEKVDQRYERVSKCIGSFGLSEYFNYLIDPEQSWDDIRWIRKITTLPIVLSGIVTGCDAIRAVENGANAIMVGNKRGTTVDTAPAAIEALSEVIEAVDVYQNVQVYLDADIRWGADIIKAVALGADAVFLSKPISWGMLHSGKCGVRRVLQLLRREFERDMAIMGTKYVSEITSTMVVSENYYRHRYRPDDVDARINQREDRLECPFGYDYDEDFDPSLEDVNELRNIIPYGRQVGAYAYQPTAFGTKK